MPLQRWTRLIVTAGFSLAVLGSFTPARAAEKAPAIDPRAESIVRAALQNIATARSISLEAEIVNDIPLDSGQRIQEIGIQKTYVRRPDRLAVVRKGHGASSGSMYYDGKLFTLWKPEENVYATWEAPTTIDALFDTMQEKIGFVPPLSVLLHEDAGAGDAKKVRSATYVGLTPIRGVDCHHVALVGENVDVQMWIADAEPIFKRIVVTYKKRPLTPQWTATFLDWNFSPRLSDYLFAFSPPPGARKIEFKVAGKP